MTLRLYSLRFTFTARDEIRFPAGKPGNVLRGALGTVFRDIVCVPDCPGARTCDHRRTCPYARVFEPSATGAGPSGLADWPRPFVFRAGHLDGTTAHAGRSFHFDLNLVHTSEPIISYFVLSFSRLAHDGLGAQRGRAVLTQVRQLDEHGHLGRTVFSIEDDRMLAPGPPLEFNLLPAAEPVSHIRVRFLAPTELKAAKKLAERPDFPVLFGRTRDRISMLRTLYQDGPLEIDFSGLGRLASAVAMRRCEVEWRSVVRRSSKTGQVHPIGGFIGEAEYEGRLEPFYPYLHLAQWTGVGRHTVWGKGAIAVDVLG